MYYSVYTSAIHTALYSMISYSSILEAGFVFLPKYTELISLLSTSALLPEPPTNHSEARCQFPVTSFKIPWAKNLVISPQE